MKQSFQPRLSFSGDSSSPFAVPVLFKQPLDATPTTKTKKKVNFDMEIHAVLIPTKDEYREAKIDNVLWYNDRELKRIEKKALVEISTGKLFDESDDFWNFIPHVYEK
jgi:hypothetical protein